MVGGLDGDEDGDREAHLVGIQDGDPALDDAVLLHPADAFPAWRGGQADLGGDVGQGQGGID